MANKEFYKMVGEVTIPEERKEELNDYVLKTLDRCGVRKIKKVKFGDLDIEVAERVRPNKDGKSLENSMMKTQRMGRLLKESVGNGDLLTKM